MNKTVEQMVQMVTPVKTTDYLSITKAKITSSKPVNQPDTINKSIMAASTPLEILTFQEEKKKLQKQFDLQGAVTNIGVQRIIDSVEEQYIKELNEEYFRKVFSAISEPTGARS